MLGQRSHFSPARYGSQAARHGAEPASRTAAAAAMPPDPARHGLHDHPNMLLLHQVAAVMSAVVQASVLASTWGQVHHWMRLSAMATSFVVVSTTAVVVLRPGHYWHHRCARGVPRHDLMMLDTCLQPAWPLLPVRSASMSTRALARPRCMHPMPLHPSAGTGSCRCCASCFTPCPPFGAPRYDTSLRAPLPQPACALVYAKPAVGDGPWNLIDTAVMDAPGWFAPQLDGGPTGVTLTPPLPQSTLALLACRQGRRSCWNTALAQAGSAPPTCFGTPQVRLGLCAPCEACEAAPPARPPPEQRMAGFGQ